MEAWSGWTPWKPYWFSQLIFVLNNSVSFPLSAHVKVWGAAHVLLMRGTFPKQSYVIITQVPCPEPEGHTSEYTIIGGPMTFRITPSGDLRSRFVTPEKPLQWRNAWIRLSNKRRRLQSASPGFAPMPCWFANQVEMSAVSTQDDERAPET